MNYVIRLIAVIVLILVLMEDTLRATLNVIQEDVKAVLILVLMEDTLRVTMYTEPKPIILS